MFEKKEIKTKNSSTSFLELNNTQLFMLLLFHMLQKFLVINTKYLQQKSQKSYSQHTLNDNIDQNFRLKKKNHLVGSKNRFFFF